MNRKQQKKPMTKPKPLPDDMKRIQDSLTKIEAVLPKIESVLLGDAYHPHGLLERHERLEKKVNSIERRILTYVSMATGVIFVVTLIWKNLKF